MTPRDQDEYLEPYVPYIAKFCNGKLVEKLPECERTVRNFVFMARLPVEIQDKAHMQVYMQTGACMGMYYRSNTSTSINDRLAAFALAAIQFGVPSFICDTKACALQMNSTSDCELVAHCLASPPRRFGGKHEMKEYLRWMQSL